MTPSFSHHRLPLFLVIGFSFLYSIFTVMSVSIVMPFVNIIFAGMKVPELFGFDFAESADKALWLVFLCAGTWIIFLLKNLFHVLAQQATHRIKHAATQEWREQFLSEIFSRDLKFFYETPAGYISARLFDTLEKVSEKKAAALYEFSRDVPLVVLYGGVLIVISWKLMLLSVLLIPLVSLSNILSHTILAKASRTRQRLVSALMQDIQQKLYAIKLIKIFNSEKLEQEKFRTQHRELKDIHRQKDAVEASGLALVEMIGVSAGVLLLYVVGMETLDGQFAYGPGGFVLFIAVVFSLIDPVKNGIKSWHALKESEILWDQIHQLLSDHRSPGIPTRRVAIFRDRIHVQNVSFRFKDRQPFLFEHLDLAIRRGEKIGVIGKSGIGKSTLIDLLLGLYKPTKGDILLDGTRVSELDRSDRARLFGVITQETFLFHDTVRNNLAYNLPVADDVRIEKALEAVQLQEWLKQQPNGLNTVIAERGSTLSGGEKQRMALARMILRDPEILIFDEATSALDLQTEALVHGMIMELFPARTIIFVSHRNSIARLVDKTIDLQHKKAPDVIRLERHGLV
jgi:subfamily B ATP-binding cassette protein MsbA